MKEKLVKLQEAIEEAGGLTRQVVCLLVSAAALAASLVLRGKLAIDPAWVAVVLCGLPIIAEAVLALAISFDVKADFLVSLALMASVYTGEIFAAGEVALIMQLGEMLEEFTVSRSRAGLEKLVRLSPQKARRITGGTEETIDASCVQVGDTLRVIAGESVPVDGVIISGSTSIDQSVMTGESLPVDKQVGDEVLSGTVNLFGVFTMKASKVGEDSFIQRMIRLVQSADAGKAQIVRFADRFATWVVVAALAAAAITWLVTGQVIRAVAILVVFCPCALVLATPTAIVAAIGNGSKYGILVKEGDALERLSAVSKVAFDKTGTLTHGKPQVQAVKTFSQDYTQDQVFAMCAAVERYSEHPLGRAIVDSYRRQGGEPADEHPLEEESLDDCTDFALLSGMGVSGNVAGKRVLAGNAALLEKHGVAVPPLPQVEQLTSEGCTAVYVCAEGQLVGVLLLSDTPRQESAATVAKIRQLGLAVVLLTGDSERCAASVALKLGVAEVRAGCLPDDKLSYIKDQQAAGTLVCMVGDGVNDAPALKASHVGVAMGGVGSDIAVSSCDIALVKDDIKEIPHLLSLSRHMMRKIKFNLTLSMTINFVAVILAAAGTLNPVAGALVHNAGSFLVIANSALLLTWRGRGG